MESHTAQKKRSKYACRNCRRKKARCPGERPVCSFCKRLNQTCEYDDPPRREQASKSAPPTKATKLSDRIAQLESQLTILAEANSKQELDRTYAGASTQSTSFLPSASSPTSQVSFGSPLDLSSTANLSRSSSLPEQQIPTLNNYDYGSFKYQSPPPVHVSLAAIDSYFGSCHNYPCTFFDEGRFRQSFNDGHTPPFLILSLVASVARLLIDPWFEDDQLSATKVMAQTAWQHVLVDVLPNEDANSVTAVQATGLLALMDFRDGAHQAGTLKLRIAITIAQNLRLNTEPEQYVPLIEQEERRHIFWTLYLMDRLSALVLDRPCLISDDECSLRLPEDMNTFHRKLCNDMPYLKAAKTSSVTINSSYAKLIMATCVIGSMVLFCHGSQLSGEHFTSSRDGLYSGLIAQADRLGELLQINDSSPEVTFNFVPGSTFTFRGIPTSFQFRYAQIVFFVTQILINHPFLLRRHPGLHEVSANPNVLHQRLSLCQEHAVELLNIVSEAQQAGAYPHTQMFPGWVMFATGLVHCLFMHSPDRAVAEVSKECFQRAQTIMYEQSMINGNTLLVQDYSNTLDFFGRNAGFASWLVDASLPTFSHPSQSTSYWRFLDFDWLCEQFCISINPFVPTSMPLDTTLAPQPSNIDSTGWITSAGHFSGDPNNPIVQQDMQRNMQSPPYEARRYSMDSHYIHPASMFPIPEFENPASHDPDRHSSVDITSMSQTESMSMFPEHDTFL